MIIPLLKRFGDQHELEEQKNARDFYATFKLETETKLKELTNELEELTTRTRSDLLAKRDQVAQQILNK